jgi:CelD/BcsL family acetyltransferase involved in cellulose biosynthesis
MTRVRAPVFHPPGDGTRIAEILPLRRRHGAGTQEREGGLMSGMELYSAEEMPGRLAAVVRASPAAEARTAANRAPLAVKLAIVAKRDDFDALEEEWRALEARAGAPHQIFQSFNWCWHWCNHYLPKAVAKKVPRPELAVVTGRVNGRLVMVWPLVVERAAGVRVLRWLGEPVSQYGDALAEDGPHRHELLSAGYDFALRRLSPDAVLLAKVRADAVASALLEAESVPVIAKDRAPFRDLKVYDGYCEFETSLPGKDRRSRRRHRRRLGEKGPVTAEVLAESAEARRLAMRAVCMKRDWLNSRGASSRAFADDRLEAFMADVAGDEKRPVGCRIGILRCGEDAAAIEIIFRNAKHAVAHIKVYAPEYELHGPGQLLTEDLLQGVFYEGAATYDLMGPDAPYKWTWADQSVVVRDYALALTWRGNLYVALYIKGLRPRLKAALGRLPVSLRQRLLRTR